MRIRVRPRLALALAGALFLVPGSALVAQEGRLPAEAQPPSLLSGEFVVPVSEEAPTLFNAEDALGLSPFESLERPLFPQQEGFEFCCDERHVGLTLIEIGTVMVIPWFFNRYVGDDSTAVIGPDTWWDNIQEGFEWDHDDIKTNMFSHPYHGGLYFNAGRSNGYNFWESAGWAWAGSFMWEMFGENNRGAINDWISTAVGGIAIGETLHRTALTVRDNQATGTERMLREFGGFLLDPMGGASRLFRGEMAEVGDNPENRYPSQLHTFLNVGVRHVTASGDVDASTGGTLQFELAYGDPWGDFGQPFDFFDFRVQMNGRNEAEGLGLLQIRGGLWGKELSRSDKVQHIFRLEQNFLYLNNQTLITGASAVSGNFSSRWFLSDDWMLRTRVSPLALLISGVQSEYSDFTKREYDFGSGGGGVLGAGISRKGNEFLSGTWATLIQRNLNGAEGTHFQHYLITRANVPVFGEFGLGGEYWLFVRDSQYRDFPDVVRRHSEWYGFVSWQLR